MVQHHTLIFFLITVASSLGFGEAKSIRRNLNSNSNVNQINGGFHDHRYGEDTRGRDQQFRPQYVPKLMHFDVKDREAVYRVPQIDREFQDENIEFEDPAAVVPGFDHYPGRIPASDLWRTDDVIIEVAPEEHFLADTCDGDRVPPTHIHPSGILYSPNDESENRHSALPPFRTRGEFWGSNANSNANTNIIGPRYRRNNNWGTLKTPYVHPRIHTVRPPFEEEFEPSYDIEELDRWFGKPNYGTTTSRPIDEDFGGIQDIMGANANSNVNSNTNVNVMHGRRTNANAIGYGGYGSSRNSEKDRDMASVASYLPVSYIPAGSVFPPRRSRSNVGIAGDYSDRRKRPNGFPTNDDENEYIPIEDIDGGGETGASSNGNVNSNSNVNIISRRNNPRHRRSVERHPKKSVGTGKLDKGATIKVVTDVTTNGPAAGLGKSG